MPDIHPTAIIHAGAQLAPDVAIGPYCIVGAHVTLGAGVRLISHAVVDGRTVIGQGTAIYPFASIGLAPQDLKYKGEPSTLVIGQRNTIREYVTMNPGTEGDRMTTTVGDDCLFMIGAHVAHDCDVGNRVILANNATLAGHVKVGEGAIIGGLAAIHQFVRIGRYAIVGGMSGVEHDVIPYGSVMGERAHLAGLNLVGLKRRGIERDAIHRLRGAFKALFEEQDGTLSERIKSARQEFSVNAEVLEILDFMASETSRSFCTPRHAA